MGKRKMFNKLLKYFGSLARCGYISVFFRQCIERQREVYNYVRHESVTVLVVVRCMYVADCTMWNTTTSFLIIVYMLGYWFFSSCFLLTIFNPSLNMREIPFLFFPFSPIYRFEWGFRQGSRPFWKLFYINSIILKCLSFETALSASSGNKHMFQFRE